MANEAEQPITFVIPVRNDAGGIRRCIESIRQQHASGIRIVVVDNGSKDGSGDVARSLGAHVLELPGLRVGELRNRGAALAESGVLAFVDADHELSADWAMAAREALIQSGVAAAGFPCVPPVDANWVQRAYNGFRTHHTGVQEARWLGAGNLAVRAEAFRQVSGFDASLEACEDVDFCQRLRSAGYTLVSDSRMESIHYGDPASLGTLFRSELWRGRNNLQVSLRGTLSAGDLPSVAIPVIDLCALVAVLGSALLGPYRLTMTAAAIFLVLSGLRSLKVLLRLPARKPLDLFRAFAVSCTYDLARALALVTRTPHRRSRVAR
jgi:GT2 family glycosyltransferase